MEHPIIQAESSLPGKHVEFFEIKTLVPSKNDEPILPVLQLIEPVYLLTKRRIKRSTELYFYWSKVGRAVGDQINFMSMLIPPEVERRRFPSPVK